MVFSLVLGLATPVGADQAITTDGPLTDIRTTSDLNCAVDHAEDAHGEFFGETACATLVAVNGVLYGPDSIPAGGGATPREPFTPVSQTGVMGEGTETDPYQVITVVNAGPLRLTQTDTYIVGYAGFRTDVVVANRSDAAADIRIWRAGDCYLQDDDFGFGQVDGSSVACLGGGRNRIEQWVPLTPGSSYVEGHYDDVWSYVGSQQSFPNLCTCDTRLDNGAGLSWDLSAPAGGTRTVAHRLSFAPQGTSADTNGDGKVRVAVLGDSYISGEGATNDVISFDRGTDTAANRCHRSRASYGYQLAQRLGATNEDLLFAACSGADALDVTSRGQYPESPFGVHGGEPQTTVLENWSETDAADIVFLSVGGNDVGFKDLLTDCIMGPCRWFAEDRLEDRVRNVRYSLAQTYDSVLDVARQNNGDAEVWVSTYPQLFSGATCGATGNSFTFLNQDFGLSLSAGSGIDTSEQLFIRNSLVPILTESVRWAADSAGVNVMGLQDLTDGHEICAPDDPNVVDDGPYINGLTAGATRSGPFVVDESSFHPNVLAHNAFADELWRRYEVLFGQGDRPSTGTSGPIPLPAPQVRLGPNPLALQEGEDPAAVLYRPGDQVNLQVTDGPPSRTLRVVVRSQPTVVDTVTVDADGRASGSFTVPDWFAPHTHHLTIEDSSGVPLGGELLTVGPAPGCELVAGDADVDGDTLPDRCDSRSDDGYLADIDGDLVPNEIDICPRALDPNQADTDGDGLGDACDPDQGSDPTEGYRNLEDEGSISDDCFVDAAYQIFLNRDATAGELDIWREQFSEGVARSRLPAALANSEEWLSVEVAKLYDAALDRGPDPGGLVYWVGRLREGARINEIGASIYASAEIYANAGSRDEDYVADLYSRILDRSPDTDGLAYWVAQIGTRSRGGVAREFFASVESRSGRVTALYERLLGRVPDSQGREHWVDRLLDVNDVRLAILLASSEEFYAISQRGCGT